MTTLEIVAVVIGVFAGIIGASALYVGLRRAYYREEGAALTLLLSAAFLPLGVALVQYATQGA